MADNELLDRVADAIAYHPGNRGGSLEQREAVARELAKAALKALAPELEELDAYRAAAREASRG